jgi:ATP-dependent metalloprotease FtsH
MDEKSYRRHKTEVKWRRRGSIKQLGPKVAQTLKKYRKGILTGTLLFCITVLLFGIVSQLPPPTMNVVPAGETAMGYSTFVQQVKANNVQAVLIRGNEIDGLLAISPTNRVVPSTTQTANDTDAQYSAWLHAIIGADTATWSSGKSGVSIDSSRMIYTQLPVPGDAALMPLLLARHVRISTLPMAQAPAWQTWLLRFLPFVFLFVLLLIWIISRNSNRLSRSIDDRVSQLGRSRARRFVRARETIRSSTQKPSPTAPRDSRQATRSVSARVTETPGVTFNDVAGIDEVRTELEEIVGFLRSPERYNRLGARIPRGALLVGPPGTGKTLLAKAVAGEAGVPFFSISASEFVEMFVGVGASRVRDLFNQARQSSPCVIFIDEIDAVGRKRSTRVNNNDERDQTLNQLLVELDGFDARKAVVVLAATNRVDILDKALLRPGRFDRHITVSLPDRAGREAILRVHTRKTPLHEEVSLERLARLTTGMTGADLANLVNEAALSAARRDLETITHECFEEALARIQLGALRPLVMSERERRIIAYHEGGHALVAYHLPEADTVNRVTILPRGQSLGVTQFTAEEDRYNYSREMLMARIAVGLGGRAAEELTFGSDRVTTGAENDLQVVTDLARRMVTRWGMSKRLGVVFADTRAEGGYALNMQRVDEAIPAQAHSLAMDQDGNFVLNNQLAARQQLAMSVAAPPRASSVLMEAIIDAEVQQMLNEGYNMARTILTEHADQLASLAEALMEHEQLDRVRFEALLTGGDC